MKDLISVIVPVYNVAPFIEKCIRSLVQQSYQNIEIILVNDGSTDNSGNICDDWKMRDSRIHVIHKQNGGLSDARNAGIEVAKGNFYSFIDSDDYIAKDALEQMVSAIYTTNSDIAICNMKRVFSDGTTQDFYCPVSTQVKLSGLNRFETLKQPSVCNKLFKAELFLDVQFPYGKFYEDTFVYHEVLYRASSIVFTGKTGYWYFSRAGSILGQPLFSNRYFDFIEAVYMRSCFLLEKNIQPFADEDFLNLYSAVANAEKNISRTKDNAHKFCEIKQMYGVAYKRLMRLGSNVGIKQRVRLILLRYFPSIHRLIY